MNVNFYQDEVRRLDKLLSVNEFQLAQVRKVKGTILADPGRSHTLAELAAEAHLSEFHFARLFRRVYGQSPGQFLAEVRMREARRMLRAGAAIADVCFELGFESMPSFTARFRRYSGTSPAVFRRREMSRIG